MRTEKNIQLCSISKSFVQFPEFRDYLTLDLLTAADKYDLASLSECCAYQIRSYLSPTNVIDAIILADRYDNADLMSSSVAVFKAYVSQLKTGEDWGKLKENPDLLLKLLEKSCE